MIAVGIDAGVENTRVVVLKDEKIIGRACGRTGGALREANAKKIMEAALEQAGIAADAVEKIAVTGKAKFDITFADATFTEPVSAVKAAEKLCPDATTVVDAGAHETIAMLMGEKRKIEHLVVNEKCAAGPGRLLSRMACRLDLSLEEMSELPPRGADDPGVNTGCVVFAELDALDLLCRGVEEKKIAAAVTEAAAMRVSMVMNDITLKNLTKVVLFGGLSQNKAFVRALEGRQGLKFVIPEDAAYAGALGAALLGIGWGQDMFTYGS